MLSPEQITQIRTQAGLSATPPAPTMPGGNDIIAQRKAALGIGVATPPTPSTLTEQNQSTVHTTGSKIRNDLGGTNTDSAGEGGLVKGLLAAKDAVGGALSVGGNIIKNIAGTKTNFSGSTDSPTFNKPQTSTSDTAQNVKNAVGFSPEPTQKFTDEVNKWSQTHPEAAKHLNSLLKGLGATGNIAGTVAAADVGIGGAEKVGVEAANGLKDTVETTANVAKNSTGVEKATKQTIDAVNPDLTGKKLTGAYKEVVTGNRSISPSGIIKEQTLSPSQRAINVGSRLSSDISLTDGSVNKAISLGKDNVKNLDILKTNLNETEDQLVKALKEHPDVKLDKESLQASLSDIKKNAPREFRAIKDNTAVYDDVIDFAKETIDHAEDSITGGRDARSAFDAAAKEQFPSAFNESGVIDIKTPAGRAIKAARDTINEHLYNVAPNGSDLKALIGREADIFNATDSVAQKAALEHGKSNIIKIKDTIKKHPVLSAVTTVGADKIIKKTTGIGF